MPATRCPARVLLPVLDLCECGSLQLSECLTKGLCDVRRMVQRCHLLSHRYGIVVVDCGDTTDGIIDDGDIIEGGTKLGYLVILKNSIHITDNDDDHGPQSIIIRHPSSIHHATMIHHQPTSLSNIHPSSSIIIYHSSSPMIHVHHHLSSSIIIHHHPA